MAPAAVKCAALSGEKFGSAPIGRSTQFRFAREPLFFAGAYLYDAGRARMMKLVDIPDLKSGAERRAGSIPAPGTNTFLHFSAPARLARPHTPHSRYNKQASAIRAADFFRFAAFQRADRHVRHFNAVPDHARRGLPFSS